MNVSDMGKQKALKELLEVLSKGVDLLANNNLDKDLYEAFEKYASSTIKMFGEAYDQGTVAYLQNSYIPHDYFNSMNNIYTPYSMSYNSAIGVMHDYMYQNQSVEYREKLKLLLQKLISIAKIVVYE